MERKTPQHHDTNRPTVPRSRSTHYGSQSNLHHIDHSASVERRTTLRRSSSTSSLKTPIKRSPTKPQPSAAEQNRRAYAENSQKVLRVLQADNELMNRLNLSNLKSMTAKQFIDILLHFMLILSGKKVTSTKTADVEVEILNFIKLIKYPNNISKSWLKTPNAPHALPDCTALLAWIANLVESMHRFNGDNDNYVGYSVKCDPEFPDVEFTEHFFDAIVVGFKLWNAQDDNGFHQWQMNLVEKNLIASTNYRIKSTVELSVLIKKTKTKISELRKFNFDIPNEKIYEAYREQIENSEETIAHLHREIQSKRDVLASIEINFAKRERALRETQHGIDELRRTIATQKWNNDDVKQVNLQLLTLRKALETVENEVLNIQSEFVGLQLRNARLVHNRTDLTSQLNKHIFDVNKISSLSKINFQLDVNQLSITTNASDHEIHQKLKEIRKFSDKVRTYRQRFELPMEEKSSKLKQMQSAKLFNDEKLLNAKTKLKECQMKLTAIEQNILKKKTDACEKCNEMMRKLKLRNGTRQTIMEEIGQNQQKLEKLRAKIVERQKKFTIMWNTLSKLKEDWIRNLDKAIAMVENFNRIDDEMIANCLS